LWCGGALVRNQARTERSWRVVVDALSASDIPSPATLAI
jgi:hypothetical protein